MVRTYNRKYTNLILEMNAEGRFDKDQLIMDLLSWMDERSVEGFYQEYVADLDPEEEDEIPEDPVVDREVKLVTYHPNTSKIALFTAEGTYWVGTYFPYRTDCNLDDPYPFVMKYGYFKTKEEGLACLAGLTGEEF